MAKQKQPVIESVEFYEAEGKHSTADFLLAAVKDYLTKQEQIDNSGNGSDAALIDGKLTDAKNIS
jgi:hypothetical protein